MLKSMTKRNKSSQNIGPKRYLFKISRVDTIFIMESKTKMSAHVWGYLAMF